MKLSHCSLIVAVALAAAPVLALGYAARSAPRDFVVQGGHPTGPGDPGGGAAFQGGHPTGPGEPGGGAAFQGGHPTGPGDPGGGGVA